MGTVVFMKKQGMVYFLFEERVERAFLLVVESFSLVFLVSLDLDGATVGVSIAFLLLPAAAAGVGSAVEEEGEGRGRLNLSVIMSAQRANSTK